MASLDPAKGVQISKVLNSAAQRATHSLDTLRHSGPAQNIGGEINQLVKQQHVLEVTADAYGNGSNVLFTNAKNSKPVLAAAGQSVVLAAAKTLYDEKEAPQSQTNVVTVSDVSAKTREAVAEAIRLRGTEVTDLTIMQTAANILKEAQATPSPPPVPEASPDPRPHSTGALPSIGFPMMPPIVPHSITTSLPDYGAMI